jgi:hypothetical protein
MFGAGLITQDERDNFRRGYEAGLTIGQIAAILQEHGYPVRSYVGYVSMATDAGLRVTGRTDPDRPWTRMDDAGLRTLIARGASPGKIASYSHRTVAACAARAATLGLFLPPYRRPPKGVSQVPLPAPAEEAVIHTPLDPCVIAAASRPWGPATKPGPWSLGPSLAEARP